MKRSFFKHLSVGLVPAGLLLVCVIYGKHALASVPEYELVCRAKAKDAAAELYKNCITENRNAQIDAIRKDYQDRLKAMKGDYERELSRVTGKSVNDQKTTKAAPKASSKKGKSAAKSAPKKSNSKRTIVVPVPTPSSTTDVYEVSGSAYEVDDSYPMDLPEPIPVIVPEEQLPAEVY